MLPRWINQRSIGCRVSHIAAEIRKEHRVVANNGRHVTRPRLGSLP